MKHYLNSGWVVVREHDIFLFVVCGNNGQRGKGGHAHNDKTSFVLSVDKEDIVISGGTYCYTCSRQSRDRDRSNFNHNVLTLFYNNKPIEQNELNKGNFILEDRCESTVDSVAKYDTFVEVKCSHSCYVDYTGQRHFRNFVLDLEGKKLRITDSEYENYPFQNNLLISNGSEHRVIVDGEVETLDYKYSDIYFSRKKCKKLYFQEACYEIQL